MLDGDPLERYASSIERYMSVITQRNFSLPVKNVSTLCCCVIIIIDIYSHLDDVMFYSLACNDPRFLETRNQSFPLKSCREGSRISTLLFIEEIELEEMHHVMMILKPFFFIHNKNRFSRTRKLRACVHIRDGGDVMMAQAAPGYKQNQNKYKCRETSNKKENVMGSCLSSSFLIYKYSNSNFFVVWIIV